MINELSIIIPTLNEEHYLPLLLESIAIQNFNGKLQVIVVDGKSQDRTVAVAQTFSTRISNLVVFESGRGLPFQRNRGAERALYQYLLFLDADLILPKNFLNRLCQKTQPDSDFLDFIIEWPTHRDWLDFISMGFMNLMALCMAPFIPVTGGSFMFTTKNLHHKINGFTEGVVMGEDQDYGQRAFKAGARYHFHIRPSVMVSTRRIHKDGRLRLLKVYVRCFLYTRKHGLIYDEGTFNYHYGEYKTKE